MATQTIKFVGSVAIGASTQNVTNTVQIHFEKLDTGEIKIEDRLYAPGLVADTALSQVITSMILTALAVEPFGLLGLAIAGGTGYLYSKYVSPITADLMLELDGQDESQVYDHNGNLLAGTKYRDGIPGTRDEAVQSLITNASDHNLSFVDGTIKLHTSVWPALQYTIKDGSVFSDIANKLGITLNDFLTTSSGNYANDNYYAIGTHGDTYVFSAHDNSALDQYLAIPVTINGVEQTINVGTVYTDYTYTWGDNQNGDNGVRLTLLTGTAGTFTDGNGTDLIIGSNVADSIKITDNVIAYAQDTILGGGGDDILSGGYSSNLIDGGSGNDVIRSSRADDPLGGKYNDIGIDTIYGGSGNDTIWGSSQNDRIDGGADIDQLNYSELTHKVNVDLSAHTAQLYFTFSTDTQSINNIEQVVTGSGDDTITGDSNANTLDGGTGTDSLVGGLGEDTFIWHSTNSGITTIDDTTGVLKLDSATNPAFEGTAEGDSTSDTTWHLNGYTLTKTGTGDADLQMTNGSNQVVLKNFTDGDYGITLAPQAHGTIQGDFFNLQADQYIYVPAGAAAPFFVPIAHNSSWWAYGNDGDDQLMASSGNGGLYAYGGAGSDFITTSVSFAGNVYAEAGADNDSVFFNAGNRVEAHGGTGDDSLNALGTVVDSFLYGDAGNDRIETSVYHSAYVDGGADDDTIIVSAALGTITALGGDGNDTIQITSLAPFDVTATVSGGAGADVVSARAEVNGHLLYTTYTDFESADRMYIDTTGTTVTGLSSDLLGGSNIDFANGSQVHFVNVATTAMGYITFGTNLTAAYNGQSLTTSTSADVVDATHFAGTVHGLDGNDSITAGTGNDTLYGDIGNDTLIGGGGNDVLDGGVGNDSLIGGIGSDAYYLDSASDVVVENAGEGTDGIYAGFTYTLGTNFENLTLTGSADINGTGNSLDNYLTGNNGNNSLVGGVGNDVLMGGVGNDSLVGGAGNDTYYLDAAGDVVTENANEGTDTVYSTVAYTLGNNLENLTLIGSADINGTGNTLANYLTGNSGVNSLSGGNGNDTLDGGAGADSLVGGAGNDIYYLDNAGDTITENASEGTDLVYSSITYTLGTNLENLTLTGTANINATGNTVANILTGNAGNNVFEGGAGNDTMSGGAGDDSYYIGSGGNDSVVENANEGTDTVYTTINLNLTSVNNIENLFYVGTGSIALYGNSSDNHIVGSSNTTGGPAGDVLYGWAGNDILDGGGAGQDALHGGDGNDSLIGGAGADYLYGDAGDDTMIGAAGANYYWVDSAGDVVTQDATGLGAVYSTVSYTLGDNLTNMTLQGTDNINGTGNSGINIIVGNAGANIIDGGDGNDSIAGGGGNDILYGGNGHDTLDRDTTDNTADNMIGGTGNDIYYVDNAGDTVVENVGEGIDSIYTKISCTISANVENLYMLETGSINATGNALNNTIGGNGSANILSGLDGADILAGYGGNDTLIGGNGSDQLTGGTGADSFYYSLDSDSGFTATTRDLVKDFNVSEGDKIDLSAFAGTFSFIGTGAFTGTAHEVNYSTSGGYTMLNIDSDGNGTADSQIQLVGNIAFSGSDFVL